jgi:hypothetical protein
LVDLRAEVSNFRAQFCTDSYVVVRLSPQFCNDGTGDALVGDAMKDRFSTEVAIESGIARLFDHIESDGPMWTGSGERWEAAPVTFTTPFTKPPSVHMSISMIDAASDRNLRLSMRASNTTVEGFTAIAQTWSDTRIGRLEIAWTAIGTSVENSTPLWDV